MPTNKVNVNPGTGLPLFAWDVNGDGSLYVPASAIVDKSGNAIDASHTLYTQHSDGTNTYIGAKTGQFPTSLGPTSRSTALCVTDTDGTQATLSDASVPVAGSQAFTGAGKLRALQICITGQTLNSTLVPALFDATAQPSAGAVPIWQNTINTVPSSGFVLFTNTSITAKVSNGLRLAFMALNGAYNAVAATVTHVTYTFYID